MTQPPHTRSKWPLVILSLLLLAAFFIPWVSWDGVRISGADLPSGHFFAVSESRFQLANPFPAADFALKAAWLIPALAAITLVAAFLNKRSSLPAILTGVLSLSLATIYIRFSNVLSDLGVQYSFQIGLYLTILAAAGIILAGATRWPAKIIFLLIGPVVVWLGFYAASSYLENEKFGDTANRSADYTVNALDLIREFQANDSLANAKYREKIIAVNGRISSLEMPNDSTVNIKFADTTGSYAIFPFHGETINHVKSLKEGDSVSVKGSCSGGVLSEILGIESITFKRCTLNK